MPKNVSPYENIQLLQNEKEIIKIMGKMSYLCLFPYIALQYKFQIWVHAGGGERAYGLIYDGFRIWVNIMSTSYA